VCRCLCSANWSCSSHPAITLATGPSTGHGRSRCPPVLPRPRVRQRSPDRPPAALELPRQPPHAHPFPKVPPPDTLDLSHLDHASVPLAAGRQHADNVEKIRSRSRWSPFR
jgi:hypothetical protein